MVMWFRMFYIVIIDGNVIICFNGKIAIYIYICWERHMGTLVVHGSNMFFF
jgi:hypothetical protein